jgi:hypothetical protein
MKDAQPQRQHEQDLSWMNKNDQKKKNSLTKKHEQKLNSLLQQQRSTIGTSRTMNIDTSNVVNKSTIPLSNMHLMVLAKGPKIVPTLKSINTVDVIANTEKALMLTPQATKQLAISEICNFLQHWKRPQRDNLTIEERRGLNELKSLNQIVIVQADKGGKIVVMDKDEYTTKIEDKLNDATLYEEVGDPTKTIKKRISELTERLFKANKITQIRKHELMSIDDLPRIRGQPKLHKPNHPMRKVTCSRNTITSPISKFAFSMIRQLRDTVENTVSNSTKFIEEISKIKLKENYRLASLDIEDLFTNIPVNRAIDIAINRIGASEKFCQATLTKTDMKQLLLMALNNSYFQFNGKFYRQKRGLPMGNPLSPILADLYMHDYMAKHLDEVCQPNRLWRYVDDILIITHMSENETRDYVKKLNSIKSNIRFTFEYENEASINFLDTKLTRGIDDAIKIRWFRKETASDRILNYHSAHHKSIKRNIVVNMATKIIETSKEPREQQEDLNKLRRMLLNSNYPAHEINQMIADTMKRASNQNTVKDKKDAFKYTISLPYANGIGVLKRKLENLKIKVFFSYPNKIQSTCTSSMKPQSKSNIYQIPCECGAVYNGETKIGFHQRRAQHKKILENDKDNPRSEMVQHHHKKRYQCLFDPDKAFIIDNEIDRYKRRIKETVYSIINNSINNRDEINRMWTPLLYDTGQRIRRIIETRGKTFEQTRTSYVQDGDSGTAEED